MEFWNVTLNNYNAYDYEEYSINNLPPIKESFPDVHPAIKVFLASIYVCMMVISGIGNLLLCCVIAAYRRMRTTTNILIGNLAWSDFLVAVICVPFNFHYYTASVWPYGEEICKLVNYVKSASLYVSTNSLLVMALDRYVIIMNPLRPRMTRLCTIIIIAFVWIFSFCLAIPTLINTAVLKIHKDDGTIKQCLGDWTNGHHLRNYTLTLIIIAFIIPMIIMTAVYSRIAVKLWFRNIPGNQCTAQQAAASEQSKKRSVRMLIILVVTFAVCFGPYYSFIFFRDVMLLFTHTDHLVYYGFYIVECLAMSNCIVDTVTYVILNPNFRKHARMLLAAIFPKYFSKPSIMSAQGMQLTRRATNSSYVGRVANTGGGNNSQRTPRSSFTYQPVSRLERTSAILIVKEDTDST
ncbi:prokineticin receptor 2-like [Antedon mediterranea]|uniref:prokineticin receptor 2-like n=1 Tax=Antedon mediterranea TaxID=105859 RepID=UPI003AF65FB8